jgi:hypothetical protein
LETEADSLAAINNCLLFNFLDRTGKHETDEAAVFAAALMDFHKENAASASTRAVLVPAC